MTNSDARPDAPFCAAPDFAPRKPRIVLPPLSCDCHAHVCGPGSRYPYTSNRVYTPVDTLYSAYQEMLTALGVQRAVLVQPSVYGADNRAMLDALQIAGPNYRGVAVVEPDIGDEELALLHIVGIRGVRVNAVDVKAGKGVIDLDALRPLASRIKHLGWHMEFLLHVNEFPKLEATFSDFPVDVVLGHLGYMPTSMGIETPGFQGLLNLMRAGRAWVKLTGPYRISAQPLPYSDVNEFAHCLIETNADRVVWGTDWPHVMLRGQMPNDADICDLLPGWIPDEKIRERVLVRNPERLYDFPAQAV